LEEAKKALADKTSALAKVEQASTTAKADASKELESVKKGLEAELQKKAAALEESQKKSSEGASSLSKQLEEAKKALADKTSALAKVADTPKDLELPTEASPPVASAASHEDQEEASREEGSSAASASSKRPRLECDEGDNAAAIGAKAALELAAAREELRARSQELEQLREEVARQRKEAAKLTADLEELKETKLEDQSAPQHLRTPKPRRAIATAAGSPTWRRTEPSALTPMKRLVWDSSEDVLVRDSFLTKRRNMGSGPARIQHVRRWVGSDSEICWDHQKHGYCPRGSKCRWRHVGQNPAPPIAPWLMQVKEEPED